MRSIGQYYCVLLLHFCQCYVYILSLSSVLAEKSYNGVACSRNLYIRPYKLAVTHDSGSGDTIVFLHGIASTSHTWRNVLPLMPITFRSITLDLLGFGESPKPDWNQYSLEAHADAVALTIKKCTSINQLLLLGTLWAVSLPFRSPSVTRSSSKGLCSVACLYI